MPRVIYVTVDADIAAGKTTLIARIIDRLRWRVVVASEPVDKWHSTGLLTEMYKSLDAGPPHNEGVPAMFQIYTFTTRTVGMVKAMREAEALSDLIGDTVVLLSERSVFSDRDIFRHMLAEQGHITSVQQRMYDECFNDLIPTLVPNGTPDLCIWVDTKPATCIQRHKIRARDGEILTVDYAQALHERHKQVFGSGTAKLGNATAPVLRIDGSQPFHNDDATLERIVADIENAIERCV